MKINTNGRVTTLETNRVERVKGKATWLATARKNAQNMAANFHGERIGSPPLLDSNYETTFYGRFHISRCTVIKIGIGINVRGLVTREWSERGDSRFARVLFNTTGDFTCTLRRVTSRVMQRLAWRTSRQWLENLVRWYRAWLSAYSLILGC